MTLDVLVLILVAGNVISTVAALRQRSLANATARTLEAAKQSVVEAEEIREGPARAPVASQVAP